MKFKYCFLVLFLILLDQLTKALIYKNLQYGELIAINSFLDLYYVHNYGAAFSFLADGGGWQRYFLASVSTVIAVAIIVWMIKVSASNILKLVALSILLAGAIGNLIDRLFFGFVVDFIQLHYHSFYWPVFNVADSLIITAAVLLIIENYLSHE